MFARLWPHTSKGARVFADLHALAVAGDMEGLTATMRKWDAVQSVGCANLSMLELSLQSHDDVPDAKAVVLHRVLTAAAEAGQVDIARCLIEQYHCVVCVAAIRAAFKHERWAVLELFLEKDWDINSAVLGNNTYPILKEVLSSKEQSKWCLDHGANPTQRTAARDHDVASIAGRWAPLPVIKLLQEYGVDYAMTDALQNAALSLCPGRLEVMAYLVHEAGFPINQIELEFLPDVYREYAPNGLGTALHSAVKGESAEALKFLLENGGDRDRADTKGCKPIDLARANGLKAGIMLLE